MEQPSSEGLHAVWTDGRYASNQRLNICGADPLLGWIGPAEDACWHELGRYDELCYAMKVVVAFSTAAHGGQSPRCLTYHL